MEWDKNIEVGKVVTKILSVHKSFNRHLILKIRLNMRLKNNLGAFLVDVNSSYVEKNKRKRKMLANQIHVMFVLQLCKSASETKRIDEVYGDDSIGSSTS